MSILGKFVPTVHPLTAVAQTQHPTNPPVTPDQLAWLNDDADNYLTSYPGLSWDADRFEPSPTSLAQAAGFGIGYELIADAVPPADLESLLKVCWLVGYADGLAQRRADDEERLQFEADLAEAAFGHQASVDHDEAIRAVGCVKARREGGRP